MAVKLKIHLLGGEELTMDDYFMSTVREIKERISQATLVPACTLNLCMGTEMLEDHMLLSEMAPRSDSLHISCVKDSEVDHWLAKVKAGVPLENAPLRIKKLRDVVLAAVKHSPENLEYASEDMQGDPEIVKIAAEKNYYQSACYASPQLKADAIFQRLLKKLRGQQNLSIASAYPHKFYGKLNPPWRVFFWSETKVPCYQWWADDDSFLVPLLEFLAEDGKGLLFRWLPAALKGRREIVLAAVKGEGAVLHIVAPSFQQDHEVIEAAVQAGCPSLEQLFNNFPVLAADCRLMMKLGQYDATVCAHFEPSVEDVRLARVGLELLKSSFVL